MPMTSPLKPGAPLLEVIGAGQDLQQLRGASADDGDVLDLLARDGGALLTGRDRRELRLCGDGHLFGEARDPELERRQVPALAEAQDDAFRLDGLKAAQLGANGIRPGLHGGEHEVAGVVADRGALVAGQLVDQRDRDPWKHRVAAVHDGAAQQARQRLRAGRRCQRQHRQQVNERQTKAKGSTVSRHMGGTWRLFESARDHKARVVIRGREAVKRLH
jgi:hypothetical protein